MSSTREAACVCGQLKVRVEGEPVRISICHCMDCQRRTGSVFGTQARFKREHTAIDGRSTEFTRTADTGNTVTTYFCPVCGSTVYWEFSGYPDVFAVAIGAFADQSFPEPKVSVYERRQHPWALTVGSLPLQHFD